MGIPLADGLRRRWRIRSKFHPAFQLAGAFPSGTPAYSSFHWQSPFPYPSNHRQCLHHISAGQRCHRLVLYLRCAKVLPPACLHQVRASGLRHRPCPYNPRNAWQWSPKEEVPGILSGCLRPFQPVRPLPFRCQGGGKRSGLPPSRGHCTVLQYPPGEDRSKVFWRFPRLSVLSGFWLCLCILRLFPWLFVFNH